MNIRISNKRKILFLVIGTLLVIGLILAIIYFIYINKYNANDIVMNEYNIKYEDSFEVAHNYNTNNGKEFIPFHKCDNQMSKFEKALLCDYLKSLNKVPNKFQSKEVMGIPPMIIVETDSRIYFISLWSHKRISISYRDKHENENEQSKLRGGQIYSTTEKLHRRLRKLVYKLDYNAEFETLGEE